MRVLFITHRLPYAPNRGDRIRSYHILRALGSRGVEVSLVSLVHDEAEEAQAAAVGAFAARVITARVHRVSGLARGLAALARGRPLTHALLDSRAMRPALALAVSERPPDVVLAYGSGMARFALEPPLAPRPLVLDLVDVDSAKWAALGRSGRPPLSWIYAREARRLGRFEAEAARRARTALVVNERERDALLRLAPSAVVRIAPNGVDARAFRPDGPPATAPRVVFCGVLDYPPNADGALWLVRHVWPIVRRRRADAALTIVGANPSGALREAAAAEASVELLGAVPDVRPHLHRAAVAVAPIRTARGIQNKVLEALAAGLPCVVTSAVREGLPVEVLAGCLEASAADRFASGIVDLLRRSPADRRELAGRARLDALTWERRLGPLVDALEAAAGCGRPAPAA